MKIASQDYQISTGQSKYDLINAATRAVELRLGNLKVKPIQGSKIKISQKDQVMTDSIQIDKPNVEDPAITPVVVSTRQDQQLA